MKVKELIEILNKYDENMEVFAVEEECNPIEDSDKVKDILMIKSGKNNSINGIYIIF